MIYAQKVVAQIASLIRVYGIRYSQNGVLRWGMMGLLVIAPHVAKLRYIWLVDIPQFHPPDLSQQSIPTGFCMFSGNH